MSPRRATAGSYKPKEGRAFGAAIKISLHREERDAVARLAEALGTTPSELVRDVVRAELALRRHPYTEDSGKGPRP